MPEITIRSANSKDIESLAVFEHGYYSEYVWQMSLDLDSDKAQAEFRRVRLPRRVYVPYPRKREEIFLGVEKAEALLVADLGSRVVGYVRVLSDKDSKVARVSDLVVSGAMRRQGIASGLLLAALDLATHRKFQTVMLEMQSKNDPAIKMAAKLGFNFCGFRDQYFPNQELAMFFSRFAR